MIIKANFATERCRCGVSEINSVFADSEQQLKDIVHSLEQALQSAGSSQALGDLRVEYLGKKSTLSALMKMMGKLSAEQRPVFGQLCNSFRAKIEDMLAKAEEHILQRERSELLEKERIDITLPGRSLPLGSWHPVSLAQEQMESIFMGMGFRIVQGPEVETDYYNFQAMNLPLDHPAREMQDTFYLSTDLLLRTHTSPMQARTMEKHHPQVPLKIIVPGKTYRRDEDATHSPMFHQIEGLYVDHNVSLAHLKGILLEFARAMFGDEREIRLRPSFFPFTEPSAEVDISCFRCGGKGCSICKGTGWIEILGSGMVHPEVLRTSGYDPEVVSGFAFGIGIDRVAMLKFGIEDIRQLFSNDIRFLANFH